MNDKPYTPTPAAFRRALEPMASKYFVTSIAREQFIAEYDRMIAQVEAAAEQRGKEQAWDEGYQDGYNDGLSDGHNLDNMRDPNENPYRADQEGDE